MDKQTTTTTKKKKGQERTRKTPVFFFYAPRDSILNPKEGEKGRKALTHILRSNDVCGLTHWPQSNINGNGHDRRNQLFFSLSPFFFVCDDDKKKKRGFTANPAGAAPAPHAAAAPPISPARRRHS